MYKINYLFYSRTVICKNILLLYVEAHIFILETLEKLGIYYRIMLVLLLFMHLLVVD